MHSRCRYLSGLACLAVAIAACAPKLGQDAPAAGNRPVFSPETGTIPLPNDILKDPKSGHLALPIADDDAPLTKEIKASIGRLDGWLAASTVTIPFDVELDRATVTTDNVLLYDVTHAGDSPPVVTKLAAKDYGVYFNVGRAPATAPPYNVIVKLKPPAAGELPADFTRGARYAAIVTDAVRDKDGNAFIDNPIYYFLRSRTPLAVNGKSQTILPDENAAQLEPTRALCDQALLGIEKSGGSDRAHALAFTVFSIESGARAVINPTIIGTRLKPEPWDVGSSSNAALDVKPTITYDAPIDPATLAAGTHLYRFENGAFADEPVTAAVASVPEGDKLTISPGVPLHPASTYVVVLTDAIKGKNGVATEAFSFFSLVRNKSPLIDASKSPPALNSAFLDNSIDVLMLFGKDPATATPADWSAAYVSLTDNLATLEDLRKKYAPYFDAAEKKGLERLSITALWQFTTSGN